MNKKNGKPRHSSKSLTPEEKRLYLESLTPEERRRLRAKQKKRAQLRKKRRLYRRIRRDLILLVMFVMLILILLGIKKLVVGIYHIFTPETTTEEEIDPELARLQNIATGNVTIHRLDLSENSGGVITTSKAPYVDENGVLIDPSAPAEETDETEETKEAKKGLFHSLFGSKKEEEVEQTEEGVTGTLTISNIGDCTLGTDENFAKETSLPAYYNEHGADYFFKNVESVLSEDDFTVANLEGTFTTATARAEKTFCFKGDPSYVEILKSASIESTNVANNHSHDYGAQSFTDTLSTLTENSIAPFGYDQVSLVTVKGINVGLTGFDKISKNQDVFGDLETNIEALKLAGADLIIVNFHWGTEHSHDVTQEQVDLAHQAIDLGADLVIGAHPHVLQGYELYKGKYIAYSLGNFCFGGNKNPDDKETLIFQITFHLNNGTVQESEESDLNLLPCSLSSVSDHNDYKPTLLLDNAANTVLKHLEQYNEQIQTLTGN